MSGTLRKSKHFENPPHPNPLPASGERERTQFVESRFLRNMLTGR
jgi:hypothetical protein